MFQPIQLDLKQRDLITDMLENNLNVLDQNLKSCCDAYSEEAGKESQQIGDLIAATNKIMLKLEQIKLQHPYVIQKTPLCVTKKLVHCVQKISEHARDLALKEVGKVDKESMKELID